MSSKEPAYLITAVLAALLACAPFVHGCASKTVVGRSIASYDVLQQEPPSETAEAVAPQPQPQPQPQPKPQPQPQPKEVKPAEATVKAAGSGQAKTVAAEPARPAPPAPAKTVEAESGPVSSEPAKAEDKPAETPSSGVPDEEAAAPARGPTETQSLSRRETAVDEGTVPYELDLSFGGFGLSQGFFDTPVALAVDEDENIYVVDQGNFRVQKFDRFGIFQFAWGRQGLGDGEFVVEDSGGVQTLRMTGVFEFSKPIGILLDNDETRDLMRITVVDSLNHRLQRFLLPQAFDARLPDDVFVKLPMGGVTTADPDLKDAYESESRQPVILDPVYLNDLKADNVLLSPFIWGGLGFSQGLMNNPTWLAKDDSGILYVSDTENARVEGYYVMPENPSADTSFFREFGNSLDKEYGSGRLYRPTAVVYDNTGYGSFLVLDAKEEGGHVIQRFDREGEFLGVFAESGGKAGQLRQPVGMAISPFDNTVYITDRGHRKVMVYNSRGDFMFAFGGEELSDPSGIVVLRNNYVYVTDVAKNMVYRYLPR